jgi:hypothetical protein
VDRERGINEFEGKKEDRRDKGITFSLRERENPLLFEGKK